MENLTTAYEAIDMLEALGLPITQEQKQQVRTMEMKYIDDVIVPHIKKECEPILEDFVCGCHLILTYSKENGLTIQTAKDEDVAPVRIESTTGYSSHTISRFDNTKYSFNGEAPMPKRRCVLRVIHEYVKDNPRITLEELERRFPAIIMRPYQNYGVVRKYEDVARKFNSRENFKRRYYIEEDEILVLDGGVRVVVSNQWGSKQFEKFLAVAKQIYPNIRPE